VCVFVVSRRWLCYCQFMFPRCQPRLLGEAELRGASGAVRRCVAAACCGGTLRTRHIVTSLCYFRSSFHY
jgi:hypothetical protein